MVSGEKAYTGIGRKESSHSLQKQQEIFQSPPLVTKLKRGTFNKKGQLGG